jgi:hypothetical protein
MLTNTQLYLVIGLPVIVSLLNTAIIILYVNAKVEGAEKALSTQLQRIEDRLGTGK